MNESWDTVFALLINIEWFVVVGVVLNEFAIYSVVASDLCY